MMNEIDELKNQWRATTLRLEQLEQDNARLTAELRESRLQPSLHRLACSYRNMAIVAAVMLVLAYPFFFLIWVNIWPAPITAVFTLWLVVFGLCLVEDTCLYSGVKAINLATMSVEEVRRRATKCRKMHLICQAVLMPIAVAFLWVLYVQAPQGRIGMLVGGLIGAAFGVYKWLQIMRAYRQLI